MYIEDLWIGIFSFILQINYYIASWHKLLKSSEFYLQYVQFLIIFMKSVL